MSRKKESTFEVGLPVPEERTMLPEEAAFAIEEKIAPPLEEKASTAQPAAPIEPQITVDAFVRRALPAKDPIAIAFVSEEKRLHRVRKLSEMEWRKLYDAFRTAPR